MKKSGTSKLIREALTALGLDATSQEVIDWVQNNYGVTVEKKYQIHSARYQMKKVNNKVLVINGPRRPKKKKSVTPALEISNPRTVCADEIAIILPRELAWEVVKTFDAERRIRPDDQVCQFMKEICSRILHEMIKDA